MTASFLCVLSISLWTQCAQHFNTIYAVFLPLFYLKHFLYTHITPFSFRRLLLSSPSTLLEPSVQYKYAQKKMCVQCRVHACVCVCVWNCLFLHAWLTKVSVWVAVLCLWMEISVCMWILSDCYSHKAVMRLEALSEKHKHRQPVFYLPLAVH